MLKMLEMKSYHLKDEEDEEGEGECEDEKQFMRNIIPFRY